MTASLVVQTSFIGDCILTTPLIAHLAQQGPVDVVCIPAAAGLFVTHPAVRDVIVYDKRGADRGVRGFVRLVTRLRAKKYTTAYFAQASVRSASLGMFAGIPTRVGFANAAGRRFYTQRVLVPEGVHHVERLFALAGEREHAEPPRPRLFPGARERAAVDELLSVASYGGEPLIAFAPGSVWATKRWPAYADLAALLPDEWTIVVVGAPNDTPLAAAIAESARGRVIDATGKLSLLASAELIGRCMSIVTNDSAPLHLASAMDTPTVAMFGPTVPAFGFGPLADRRAIAGIDSLSCRPCDKHGPQRCPLGHWRCMREISAEQVRDLVHRVAPTVS